MPEVDRVLRIWWDLRAGLRPAPGHTILFVSTQPRGSERFPPLTTSGVQMMVARLSKEVCGVVYRPHWRYPAIGGANRSLTTARPQP